MSTYTILIILCGLVIFSYLFDMIAKKTKIPSVLLLLFLGIGLKQIVTYFQIETFDFLTILPTLGTVGLILIVFEGALDLKYDQEKNRVIKKTLLAAVIILLVTTAAITFIIHELTGETYYLCFANAIPFSVISSSIAIPSAANLGRRDREFVIYESSFSDIAGIILFNFAISNDSFNVSAFASLGAELVMIFLFASVSCLLLLYLIGKISHHVKFFLIISILVLVYAVGQSYHLSALIIVLAFGLFLNNADEIRIPFFRKYFIYPNLSKDLVQLHQLSAESAFLMRTFFFIIFGFTIVVNQFQDLKLIQYGLIILGATYLIRLLYLKFVAKVPINPIVFITPRGLISILLFYNLPKEMRINGVETGLLFMMILATSVVMSLGLLSSKKEKAPVA
ncbi:sodium:proton antiporter [Pelobium manganitolerans]|uniref:Sodium:proton antiporter n=1 Tax=Pelobium manganitolerans TaxID=1842495 RepID=A0A419S393_9SPHI|nr:cation:proton antiporter [Pelobium manganitolerans]RKD13754.1 sodium:proton antiporter [Pelobium manganitolerans]